MVERAELNFVDYDFHGLSVFGSQGMSAAQLCDACKDRIPHPKIRIATVSDIVGAGFELRKTDGPHHYDVVLNDADLHTQIVELLAWFGDPVPNPART